ncbi:MAG: ABC transporter [Lachnospiraceae bacterium]|nr:ABC transporter [Lachnospiraceae bacterium]
MDFKKNMKNRAFRKGTYSVGLMVIVFAIVVILNMIIQSLPSTITKIDYSINKLYTLTDTTVDYLKGLDKDVELYLLAPIGEENESLCNMLDKYAAWSSHVTFEQIDPKVNPNFISQYTSELVETNSVVVVSEERSKIVEYSSFSTYVFDFKLMQYVAAFDGEGLITSAINYVVTDDLPKMYISQGHNEELYTDSFAAMVNKANVVTESINLLEVDAVPEDCEVFFVYSPSVDFTESEVEKLITYLDKGGSLMLVSGDTGVDFVNLSRLLEYCGLELQEGIVIETNSKYFLNNINVALKPARAEHQVTASLINKGISVYIPNSQGIAIRDDARSSLTITKLLSTSKDSYIRTSAEQVLTMQDDDIPGPVTVGALVEEKLEGVEKNMKLAVYSSGYLLNDSCNIGVSGANFELALNTIAWMCETDDNISISPKSTALQLLSVTTNDFYKWAIILVVAVPVVIIGTGFAVWFIRRRK